MKIRSYWMSVLIGALCLLLSATTVLAQTESGQITGTVRDQSGGVVVGAKVTVKSPATGMTRDTTTNTAGAFTLAGLRPDSYDLTIDASGFAKFGQRIQVAVGSVSDVSAQLNVSGTVTTIEVADTSAGVSVNTESQTQSSVVTSQQLNDLPTSPTRNPYALVATSGNVSEDSNSGRGAGFSINGQRSSSTSILLDGAENVDAFTAGVGQTVPLDSVQEFSVLTNNFTAEFGRASGGVVNVVTKSGSNTFHGSAYEYNRLSALSSNTYNNNATDTPKGIFTRNNFGWSLGGPVKKDKLFFFDNLEWIRVRSSASEDFSIIDPSSYPALASSSQAFFKQYGAMAAGVRTFKTLPCGTLTCDEVSTTVPADAGGGSPQNTWQEVAKVDFNMTDKTSMFFRYAGYSESDFAGTVDSSPYAGYSTGQTNFDQNFVYSLTHLFSSTMLNSTKLIYNRINGPNQPLGTAPIGPTLYTASSLPEVGGYPLIFPGYSETTPGNSIPFVGPQNLYQIYEDFSWTKGKHQFKFGGQFIQIRDNRTYGAYESAVEYLGTNLSTGLADLISGNIHQFQSAIYPQGKYPCPINPATGSAVVSAACTITLPVGPPAFERNYRYNDSAFYVQDAWRIAPRFTANLGLRWEYYGVQHNASNTGLDSNFVMGSGDNIFEQIRNGSVQLAANGGVFWHPDYGGWGPRAGFAYDLFGNGNTSLRGGYSIAYERNFGNVTFNAIQNPPNYAVVSLIAGTDVPSMPVYTDNYGPLAGTGSKALPVVSQRAINQNMKMAYANTWNFGIEHKLTANSVVSAFYSGSHGVHEYDISNINPTTGGSLYLGDARAANRLNYQYSNMNFRSDGGFSHYDALNLKYTVTNAFKSGLSATANYTWSHSMDNLSSTFSETNGGNSGLYYLGYLDGFNPRLGWGNSDYDVRQRFVLSGIWETPWLKNSPNHLLRSLVGGWGIGSILNIRSGMPFSIYDCTNVNDTSCPMWIPSSHVPTTGSSVASSDGPNLFNYISLPAASKASGLIVANTGDGLGMPICSGLYHQGCRYTQSGLPYPDRNQYFGPGFWNLDANIQKNFRLTERFTMQFRAEMYNIFNHNNQYITGLNLDVSSMVSPDVQTEKGGPWGYNGTTADERRNIQFALRLMF